MQNSIKQWTKTFFIGVALISASACSLIPQTQAEPVLKAKSIEANEALLYQGEWQLISLQSKKAGKGVGGYRLSINFDPKNNKVFGFAGCNHYFSLYTIDADALSIGALGITRKHCAKHSELEAQFIDMLSNAKFYQIEATQLVLLDEQKQAIAVFVKA